MNLFKNKKNKKIIFNINEEGNGFVLSTELVGEINMEHIRAVNTYTGKKLSEFNAKIKKSKGKRK